MSTSVSSLTTNTVEIPLTRGKTAIVDAEAYNKKANELFGEFAPGAKK